MTTPTPDNAASATPVAWLDLGRLTAKNMVYATGFKVNDAQSPLYSAATVTALEAEVRELVADRDSWRDQASERVKDWDKERQRADAAERRVSELEDAAFAARGRLKYLNSLTGEKIDADLISKINSALTGAGAK